ncbi:MAG: transglutaminase domain-containing protein [Clostridiales bacterium]|nr:transglutaminase domain-containing protein [Clostridiales bacterium]
MAKQKAQTIKKSKTVFIVGMLTVGIVVLLAVYFILIATGVITAAPNRLTIATAGLSVEYDGKEHSIDEWWIEGGELKAEHELSLTVTGSRTEAGVSKNTVEYKITDGSGYDVTDTYDVELNLGDIEVLPRGIVVSSASAEKKYDGTPLKSDECKIERGTLVTGHEIQYFVTGTLTASGKIENKFTALVFDGNKNVSANYEFEYLYGILHVVGELIEISTPSAQKVYDGTPLTKNGYSMTSGHAIDGDSYTVTVTGSQTEVGSTDNVAVFKAIDTSGRDVTAKYEVIFTFGQLTVTPIIIRIETRSDYKVYDGKPLTADGWRVVCDETIAGDIWLASGKSYKYLDLTVTATVAGERTLYGNADNEAVFVTASRNGEDASDYVEFEYSLGTLTVLPRPVTISSGSKSKQFDGEPLTFDSWEVLKAVYGIADGQTVYVTVSGTITYVGTAPNTIAEVVIFDKDGRDVTNCYSIKLQEGQLVVYGNGQPEGGNGQPEGQGVGSDDERGEGQGGDDGDENGSSGDLSDSGSLSGSSGDDEENILAMRVFTDKSTRMYLRYTSFGDYNYSGFNPAEDYSGYLLQTLDEMTGKVRSTFGMNYLSGYMLWSAGKTYNSATIERVNTSQYYLPYYQTMDELICTAQNSDVKYVGDGNTYKVNYYAYDYAADLGVSLNGANLGRYAAVEKNYRKFVYNKYTSVPADTLEYLNTIIDAQGFSTLSGGALVSAVASYVQSAAAYSLEYDKALDKESDVVVAFLSDYKQGVCRHYSAAATLLYRALGIPARYCVGYTVQTSANEWTEVWTKDCAHAWVEVYIDGKGWYQVEVTGGSSAGGNPVIGDPDSDARITIKPFDRYLDNKDFIKSGKSSFTYEGDRLQGLTSFEDAGYSYKFTVQGAATEVGVTQTRITAFSLFDQNGRDVTNEYCISLKPGKLQIYLEEITVSTADRSKVYDGTPLLPDKTDYSMTGKILSGHKIDTALMPSAQRNVGSSANVCTLIIIDENGNNVTDYYKITDDFGTLTVTPRAIVIKTGSAVGYLDELDGPLTCDEFEVFCEMDGEAVQAIVGGDEIFLSFGGAQSTIGQSMNTVDGVFITAPDGSSAVHNYAITYEYGKLTVLPFRLD